MSPIGGEKYACADMVDPQTVTDKIPCQRIKYQCLYEISASITVKYN